MKLHLRIEPGDPNIPGKGDTVTMQAALSGDVYAVTVRFITRVRIHPDDGAILLDIEGTRKLIATKAMMESPEFKEMHQIMSGINWEVIHER